MASVAVGGVSFAQVASAQEAAKADEKVTVTGSRIRQRDFTSTSPIATVSAKDIALTGTVNVESLINDLPQVVPGVTVTSNNPSLNGFATADLRGLGPGRTLILVNGRRANPSDRSGAVDLNTIPASLIERIEIISGGASAVYGADAVAGAINFIMRDNFEGVQVSAGYQQDEDGSAPQLVIDGLIGGKFDSGRGSLMLGVQYYDRQPVAATARQWSRETAAVWSDNTTGNLFLHFAEANPANATLFNPAGSGTAPWSSLSFNNVPGANATARATNIANGIIAATGLPLQDVDCDPLTPVDPTLAPQIRFNNAGGIERFQGSCGFAANNNQSGPLDRSDRYNFAPDNLLILENERINASVYGKYDIVEGGVMQAFVESTFTNSRSMQQLAATPVTGLTVRVDLDPLAGTTVLNPYVAANAQLLTALNSIYAGNLDNVTMGMNIRPNQGGFRVGVAETNAIGITYGLRGNIPSLDWDWEVYHGFARNTTNIFSDNNVGATAIRQLINACGIITNANQPQPLTALPNCPFPTRTGAGPLAFVPTGTTNNPLGLNSLSKDMLDFIRVSTTDVTIYERNTLSGSLTGDLWDLWGAGAIAMAVGVEYRDEALESRADAMKAAGDIFGFNAQESIKGRFDVYEAFGEVKVPLINGVSFFEDLNIEAGYRISDYSTGTGKTETWKYGMNWTVFEGVTLRAIENHAVRAPTAFELFQGGDQNFPGYTDPCNTTAINALAAGLRAARVATCNTWFAASGAVFPGYVLPGPNVGGHAQVNSQVQSFQFGTPGLKPEIADTLTYGIVFNPDWFPVGRFGLSVDRYEIEIAGIISLPSVATILSRCVTAGGVGPDCALAPRNPVTGQIDAVNQSRSNRLSLETSGIDVNLQWATELEGLDLPGTLRVASTVTWVDNNNTYDPNNPCAPVTGGTGCPWNNNAVGFHDGTIGGGTPEYRAATNITYQVDDFNFLVRWTYTDGMIESLSGNSVPEYNLFDFGSTWDATENVQFSFGVENIFDKQPPLMVDSQIFGQYNTDGSTYDQLGRQFRVGVRWRN